MANEALHLILSLYFTRFSLVPSCVCAFSAPYPAVEVCFVTAMTIVANVRGIYIVQDGLAKAHGA